MYNHEIFGGERDLHVGIDIGAPVGSQSIPSPRSCLSQGINAEDGSYGPTIIVEYELDSKPIWVFMVTYPWNVGNGSRRNDC